MKSPAGLKVVYRECFQENDSPARVYRDYGVIEINMSRWKQLPQAYRDYILAHEEGHYALDTSDELAADEYAFKKLAGKMPGSLRATVHALINVLPGETPEQRKRMEAAVCRALKYDARHNRNQAARSEYIKLTGKDPLSFYGAIKLKNWQTASVIAVIIIICFIIRKWN
jgi:hypothetical protein